MKGDDLLRGSEGARGDEGEDEAKDRGEDLGGRSESTRMKREGQTLTRRRPSCRFRRAVSLEDAIRFDDAFA